MAEKEFFDYTYSAPQRSEIQRIREKYLPKEISPMDRLRELDKSATRRGSAISLAHGILYALLLGLCMSCCLVWAGKWFLTGVLIGLIGIVGVSVTYPIYNRLVREDREKLAPEILRLTEELIHTNY